MGLGRHIDKTRALPVGFQEADLICTVLRAATSRPLPYLYHFLPGLEHHPLTVEHYLICSRRGRVYVLANWEREGGLNGAPYISCEETYWTPDFPEKPLSILPFHHLRGWIGEDPIDLRDLEMSVYLSRDGLKLNGGECYFWVVGPGTRWHLNSRPIGISMGE